MKNINIEKLLADLITVKRADVIKALEIANVMVNNEISNQRLYEIVMIELNKGNQALIVSLGAVLDQTFDLTPLFENKTTEVYSNATAFGDFLKSDNFKNIASAGGALLGGLFGGGGSSTAAAPAAAAPSSGGTDMTAVLLMQQQQQAAQAARDEQRRAEEAASSKTTMWVVGGIAAFLIVGGIITAIVVTRSKPSNQSTIKN